MLKTQRKSAHENKTFVYEKGIFRNFLSKIPKRDQKKQMICTFLIFLSSTLNKYAKNKESAERDKSTWVHIRTAMIMWNSFFPSFLLYVFKPFISRLVGWYLSFARLSTWSHSTHEILRRGKHCENFLYQFYSKILDDEKNKWKKVQIKLMYTIMRSSGNVSRLFQ